MKRFALCTLLLLTACATPEEIEARKQAQAQADFDTCISYGLRPGSEAFGMCRLELDLTRRQTYNATRYYGGYGHGHHGHFISGVGVGF